MNQKAPSEIRTFGVELVGAIPWGTHLCQLYETKQDLLDILVPYFKAGLKNNEFCLWITSAPLSVEAAKNTLRVLDNDLKKGQIEILPFNNWYGSRGKFDAEKLANALIEKVQSALNHGFDGLRVAGNLPAGKQPFSKSFWKKFTAYEKIVHQPITSHNILALCAYPLENCTSYDIIDVERLHGSTLVKRDATWFFVEDAGQRKKSEERYRNIIQTSIDAFWIVDYEGRFLDVNKAYCDIIGYTHDELLSMGLKDVELNENPQEILQHMTRIRNSTHDRFETRHLCKNAQPVDLEISANYMPHNGGGTFAVFAHNITRRKRNEDAIKQSESRYRELADSITDSFVALDAELKYTYCNKAYEKITGIPTEAVLGKHFFSIFGKNKSTKKIAKIYLTALKTQKPQIFVDELTMGDRKVVVENYVYPTRTGVSVFTKDITQRKELQDKLSEYAQHLEDLVKVRTEKLKNAERLATIGEVAGMVGHDIRNPLQSISGELYLAKNELDALTEGETKKALTESVEIIGEQLTYINKIVSDLQDYAKTLTPHPEEVDLKKTIKEILSSVNIPQYIQVTVSVKRGFPKLKTDSSYLKRILINLITNAVQAMSKGGKLTITASNNKQYAFIHIQDTGGGIPEDAKPKIFKPLFTTKSKGQGFGLAVVKKLTDALGGNVSFESTTRKGTRFTVEIPLHLQLK